MQETKYTFPTVLTIAGFDGSGGAGIQADIKTISALGAYATTVLTALPVQNTMGVQQVHPIPTEIVTAQLEAVLEDIRPHAIKIGMLHTEAHIEAICTVLSGYPDIPVILDPVMVSTSGKRLLDESAIATMQSLLFPHIALLTPNMDEAAILAGIPIQSVSDMERAAAIILQQGGPAVLVKGGHMEGEALQAVYGTVNGEQQIFIQPRVDSNNTHGTGCTLSAAIATFLAKGYTMTEAIEAAKEYVHKAILASKGVHIGSGKGSLNHFFDPQVMHPINR